MVIGTHHGQFHADDVFAVAMLKQLYPDASIVRTRDPSKLASCDIVVDVGRERYDHHTTEKEYRENGIPYASAGLIWRDFGKDIAKRFGWEDYTEVFVKNIDDRLIQGIDAIDNGVDLEKDARVKGIPEVIGSFNPTWNSADNDDDAFARAVMYASQILHNYMKAEIARIEASEVVQKAFRKRMQKEILMLDPFCPWNETLLNIDTKQEVLYVIFPDKFSQYRIQVVPKEPGTFEARKPLPLSWAGKEGEELGAIIGIDDAVFCHPARFIAGALSKESILKMAQQAIDNNTEEAP